MNKYFKKFFWGLFARIINIIVPTRPMHWVFGSDYGNMYREGSKYLMEYVSKSHPEIKCTFITQNQDVKRELNNKGLSCEMNFSFNGILSIAKADAVFTTQYFTDLLFSFKKENRKFYYLIHGQPYKQSYNSMPSIVKTKLKTKDSFVKKLKKKIYTWFVLDYGLKDVSFVSVSSDFLVDYLQKDMPDTPIKVLGMPRNDALKDDERMKDEKWIGGLDRKYVITYMPTHRLYGKGDLSPVLFAGKPDYLQWLRDHNVVVLIKQHPNMIPKLKDAIKNDVIIDITKDRLDPQVVLYHSDMLITDYSSVWIDYLILERPMLFYIYDDFEGEDSGCHYDIKEDFKDTYCYTEEELFSVIQSCVTNKHSHAPKPEVVRKYNKFIDGKSCERYFNEILKDMNY